jgi:hypothetical protein
VDDAYAPVEEAVATIRGGAALGGLRDRIAGLKDIIAAKTPDAASDDVSAVRSEVNAVPGSRPIASQLSKVRRALRGRSPDKAAAQKALTVTLEAYDAGLAWRERAANVVLPALEAYEAAIRGTIGLRQQSRLPDERLSDIAGCLAFHRDISLHF